MFKLPKHIILWGLFLIGLFGIASCSSHDEATGTPATPRAASVDELDSLHQSPDGTVNADYATLRDLALSADTTPPRMMPQLNNDVKQVRNYPEQPPVIPHKIDSYQVDKNHNQCMDCHQRANVGVSQAPMVSITHFMDRDGQFLASVSPRRYYCNQCHVPQLNVEPLVENEFVDVDTMIALTNEVTSSGKDKH